MPQAIVCKQNNRPESLKTTIWETLLYPITSAAQNCDIIRRVIKYPEPFPGRRNKIVCEKKQAALILGARQPPMGQSPSFTRFLDHTKPCTTGSTTPLDE
jgi:hypothetical protein